MEAPWFGLLPFLESLPYSLIGAPWDHLPNKPLARPSLFQGLFWGKN